MQIYCWNCSEWCTISKDKYFCELCNEDVIDFQTKMVMGNTGYVNVSIEELTNYNDNDDNDIYFVKTDSLGYREYYIIVGHNY